MKQNYRVTLLTFRTESGANAVYLTSRSDDRTINTIYACHKNRNDNYGDTNPYIIALDEERLIGKTVLRDGMYKNQADAMRKELVRQFKNWGIEVYNTKK